MEGRHAGDPNGDDTGTATPRADIRQMTLLFDREQEVRQARLKAAVALGADECGAWMPCRRGVNRREAGVRPHTCYRERER
jgi:hypothetical protein